MAAILTAPSAVNQNAAALTPEQIAAGQAWINAQWGGNTYSPGSVQNGQYVDGSMQPHAAFGANGVYDASDPTRNLAVLGAGNAMGYSDANLGQITGLDPSQISAYRASADPNSQALWEMQFNGANGTNYSPTTAVGANPWEGQTSGSGNLGMGSGGQYGGYYSPPGGSGAGGGGVTPASLTAYSQNPYLTKMGEGLQTQFNNNLTQNTLPSLRGGAVAAGGVGGSRQGIAEGLAAGQSNTGAANAITNLYGQDYNNQMNRNLQQYGMDQNFNLGNAGIGAQYAGMANSYDLGRRGLDLGFKNSNNAYDLGSQGLRLQDQGQQMNFYNQQRGLDQNGLVIGGKLYNLGTTGQWNPLNSANGIYNDYSGLGNTTGSTSAGGGLSGILGGALSGAQFGRNMNWW